MSIFAVGVCLVATLSVQSVLVWGQMPPKQGGMGKCWPNNETMGECFQKVPKSLGPWPSMGRDNYTLADNQTGLDLADYSTTKIEQDPTLFCQYKEEMTGAMSCVETKMKNSCPSMPSEMWSSKRRMESAFGKLCNRSKELDEACMKNQMKATRVCKSMMWRMKPCPKLKSEDAKPEPEAEHDSNPKLQPGAETDSKPQPQTGAVNTSNRMMCCFKYKMMKCVKKQMKQQCGSGATPDIIADVIRDMASSDCTVKMDAWEVAAQTACEDGECDGAMTLIFSAFCLTFMVALGFAAV